MPNRSSLKKARKLVVGIKPKAKAKGKPVSKPKLKAAAVSPAPTAPDPFNLESLVLPSDFSASTEGVKKALTTLPVRKPTRQEWVRTHPTMRKVVALIEDKSDRLEYIISDPQKNGFVQAVADALPGEVQLKMLYLTVNRQGTWFLWPVRLPDPTGRVEMDWTRSLREAANDAEHQWVRVASNRALGAYDVWKNEKITAEPVWPEPDMLDWSKLLFIAFKARLIVNWNHQLLRNLLGE
jgi:hypothetical protein